MIKKPRLVNSQTITVYRYGAIHEENHFILLNPTSNFKIVSIKKDRYCEECSKLIKAQSRCYTINPKNKGRMWVCFDCMPEHGTKEEYKIGERIGDKNYYYSDEKDEWGRHKSYGKCTEDEKEFYEDETEEEVVYTNNYKKETIKESLQNYVLTKLNNGVNGIRLNFIFELEEFDKFSYSNFIQTLNENDGNLIHEELKFYLAEFLEFEQDSYGLNVGIDTINDPMEYGELVKVTAVIVIP